MVRNEVGSSGLGRPVDAVENHLLKEFEQTGSEGNRAGSFSVRLRDEVDKRVGPSLWKFPFGEYVVNNSKKEFL